MKLFLTVALGTFTLCEVVIITSKIVVKSIMKLDIIYPKFSRYNLKEGVKSQKSGQIYHGISYYHQFGCYTWKRVLNGKYNPL